MHDIYYKNGQSSSSTHFTATMAGILHSCQVTKPYYSNFFYTHRSELCCTIDKFQAFQGLFSLFSKTFQVLFQFSETQGLFKAGLEFKAVTGTL